MNETVVEVIREKIECKNISLAYHKEELKDYRALVRQENLKVKELAAAIADMEEVLADYEQAQEIDNATD